MHSWSLIPPILPAPAPGDDAAVCSCGTRIPDACGTCAHCDTTRPPRPARPYLVWIELVPMPSATPGCPADDGDRAVGTPLDYARLCRLVDEIATMGIMWVQLVDGGERPRPELAELACYALGAGITAVAVRVADPDTAREVPELADALRLPGVTLSGPAHREASCGQCGRGTIAVLADGTVAPCLCARAYRAGSVRVAESLSEAYASPAMARAVRQLRSAS